MEDNIKIPEDILAAAEKYNTITDPEVINEMGKDIVKEVNYGLENAKDAYIAGRMEERASTQIQVKITHEGEYSEEDIIKVLKAGYIYGQANVNIDANKWVELYKQQKDANNK